MLFCNAFSYLKIKITFKPFFKAHIVFPEPCSVLFRRDESFIGISIAVTVSNTLNICEIAVSVCFNNGINSELGKLFKKVSFDVIFFIAV